MDEDHNGGEEGEKVLPYARSRGAGIPACSCGKSSYTLRARAYGYYVKNGQRSRWWRGEKFSTAERAEEPKGVNLE